MSRKVIVGAIVFGFLAVSIPAEAQRDSRSARLERANRALARWMDQDVAYIITDEEKAAFKALQTDEEREQFIEQFWLRRDPTPDTIQNEYREDHYVRIAYANERFASGKPGWKTDRGRIYIIHGKPDNKESHPSGGTYERPFYEGGGTTTTYPFEIWNYRYPDVDGRVSALDESVRQGCADEHAGRRLDAGRRDVRRPRRGESEPQHLQQ